MDDGKALDELAEEWGTHWSVVSAMDVRSSPQDRLCKALAGFLPSRVKRYDPALLVAGITSAGTHSPAALRAAFARISGQPNKTKRALRVFVAGSVVWMLTVGAYGLIVGQEYLSTGEANRIVLAAVLPPVLAGAAWWLGNWALRD